MNSQNETQEMISLLICKQLIGTISEDEQQVLDEWRKADSHNEAAYQRLKDTDRLSVEYHRSQITDYHRPLADMKRRLNLERPATSARSNRPWVYGLMSAAAVLLLIFGATLFFKKTITDAVSPEETLVAQTEIVPGTTKAVLTLDNGKRVELGANEEANTKVIAKATAGEPVSMNNLSIPRGGEFKVTLEDGTEVWLNAETTLRYPEAFDGDERRVEVSGEAYFKVAKNAEKPFYVVSGGQEVRVYGTEFNVHAYNDEPTIFTTLVEGSISLRPLNGNKSELMLTPGNQSVFTRGDASARVRKVDTEVVTSWRHGVFVFEDQNLEQIMRTLSRWYNFEYEFADAKVAQTEFMGSIPRYGSFNEVIDIFKKMGGIHLTLQGTKVLISAK